MLYITRVHRSFPAAIGAGLDEISSRAWTIG
jgi:hypothetical protein